VEPAEVGVIPDRRHQAVLVVLAQQHAAAAHRQAQREATLRRTRQLRHPRHQARLQVRVAVVEAGAVDRHEVGRTSKIMKRMIMKPKQPISITRRSLGLVLILFVATGSLKAQFAEDALRFSTFNLGIGARSAGMGNASIGLADDYSALFTNPAGLASLRSYEFSVGLSNTSYINDATFFGNTLNANDRVTNLSNIGLVYPVPTQRGSLVFAFGFSRVANYSTVASFKGFNPNNSIIEALTPDVNLNSMSAADRKSLLDNNIPFQIYLADTLHGRLYPNITDSVQQEGTVREGGGLNSWSLGGAVEIAKGLTLGFGLNLLSGSYSYDRLFTETDSRNVYHYGPPFDLDHLKFESTVASDISGYNAVVGLMYRKQGRYKIGVTLRTPTYYDVSEDYSDVGKSWFDNGDYYTLSVPGSTKYSIRTPFIFSGGASFQLTDWLLLAGDAEYTDWTQMEFTNTDSQDLIDENRVIRDIFRPTTNLRGGVEVTLFNMGLKLRGGAVYNPSPYLADQNTNDYNQLYFTGGLGVAIDEDVFVNASFAIGKWKTFRDNYYLSGLTAAPSRTSESVNTSTVNVTLSYRF
jgi:long-subunit fatty acid transport protein